MANMFSNLFSKKKDSQPTADASVKNVSNYISRLQFARIRHDISMWRTAIEEAESAYWPHRVKMQRIYQDTILNEHVEACLNRRKDLTMLRKFKVCDEKGKESEQYTKLFHSSWFEHFQSYALDARMFGYSLISLGDVVNNAFPQLTVIPRQNISPDRLTVGSYVYALDGLPFTEPPYSDWHVWISTPSDLGVSPCGYGLLYKIAKAEIYLRNNTGYNADFIELFGQPIRTGKTTKTGDERDEFQAALRDMGSSAYILLDADADEVELIESKNVGTGYMVYNDFEKRLEQKISKVLLGHADAMDSIPGKLGGGSGEESPVAQALNDVQVKDGTFLQNIINGQLLPNMRSIGFNIPIGLHFEYVNDGEEEEYRQRVDESNKTTAELFKVIKDAGGEPDWKYFTERTGIPVEKAEPPQPIAVPVNPTQVNTDNTNPNE